MQRVPSSKIAVPELPPGFTPRPELLAYLDRAEPHHLSPSSRHRDTARRCCSRTGSAAAGPPLRGFRSTTTTSPHASGRPSSLRSPRFRWSTCRQPPAPAGPLRLRHRAPRSGRRPDRGARRTRHRGATDPRRRPRHHRPRAAGRPQPPVQHRPATLRLILSSRTDPPIALPRLRLKGELHELRADRLRFSATTQQRCCEAPVFASPRTRSNSCTAGRKVG